VALNIKKDISEAVNDFCKIETTIKPNAKNHRIYKQVYRKYLELYNRLYKK